MARKAHVIRIYKDDDPKSDQWIDIERLDELAFESGRGYQYRIKRWKFDWNEFVPDGPNVTKKKIVDPGNKDNFIEVPVRGEIYVEEASKGQFQGYRYKFINDNTNQSRQTHSRRVYHHDIDKGRLDDSGQPPRDPNEYKDSLGDQDKEQYVEVELFDAYWTNEKESHDAQGKPKISSWQQKKWSLKIADDDPLLNDPILKTDEIDPDFVSVFNPADGRIDPPWRLDPLQNIVNVQWGGAGIFVSGDRWGIARYAKIKSKDKQTWTGQILSFSQNGDGEILGSSYALVGEDKDLGIKGKPTFVLGGLGYAKPPSELNQAYGVIWTSNDGTQWKTVLDLHQSSIIIHVQALVWDEDAKKFYAQLSFNPRDGTEPQLKCYQSNDGSSWAIGGGDFESHCKGVSRDTGPPDLVGKPDGFYGYDEANDILIWPNDDGVGVKVKKKNEDGSDGYTTSVVSVGTDIGVACVAFAGGIWEAGGHVRLAPGDFHNTAVTVTSIDDGQTWKIVSKGALGLHDETGQSPDIETMVAALLTDFKKDTRS